MYHNLAHIDDFKPVNINWGKTWYSYVFGIQVIHLSRNDLWLNGLANHVSASQKTVSRHFLVLFIFYKIPHNQTTSLLLQTLF